MSGLLLPAVCYSLGGEKATVEGRGLYVSTTPRFTMAPSRQTGSFHVTASSAGGDESRAVSKPFGNYAWHTRQNSYHIPPWLSRGTTTGLESLRKPGAGGSPAELVEVLRKWSRWLKRAQDLGLQVPDASILLRGLDAAARPQLSHNHEVNFRTNVLRYSLDLDAAPTLATVTKYHTHLLGEFEQLTYRGRGKGGATSIPAVKNLNLANPEVGGGAQKGGSSPQTPSSGKPCKFYLSETGCQRSNCKYAHDWNAIPREERTETCKGCGGKGHMRKNCPLKGAGADGGRRGDDAKGGGAPRVRNVASSPQVGADGKRDDGTLPQAAGPSPSAPSGSASASASVDSKQSGAGAPATSSASPRTWTTL